MLHAQSTASAKRQALRARLASGELVRMPGAFTPLSAKLIEEKGFEGVYISGAVLSAELGLPDIGLTTLTEVAGRGQQIARMTDLPGSWRHSGTPGPAGREGSGMTSSIPPAGAAGVECGHRAAFRRRFTWSLS